MVKQLPISDFIRESKGSKLQTLTPGDVISVFHGTSWDDAYQFALNGLDATVHKYRKYPHTVNNEQVFIGLYVSPGMQTAREFGHVVIKFKTKVDNLQSVYPGTEEQERASLAKGNYFTKSTRPEVTDRLVNSYRGWDSRKGGYAGREQQARFVGIISPRAIERIYITPDNCNSPMISLSREEFLQYCVENGYAPKHIFKNPIEPQQTFTDLTQFIKEFSSEKTKNRFKGKGKVVSIQQEQEQEQACWRYLDNLNRKRPGMSVEDATNDIRHAFGSLPPSVAKNVGELFVKHYKNQ